jgi:hypothetical protein
MPKAPAPEKKENHEAAIRALVTELVENTRLDAGVPTAPNEVLGKLGKFFAATSPWAEYLTETDGWFIGIHGLYRQLGQYNDKIGLVKELFDAGRIKAFVDDLVARYCSVPRSYDVFFELPRLKGLGEAPVEIAPGIRLASLRPDHLYPADLFQMEGRGLRLLGNTAFQSWLSPDASYLIITARGFADQSVNSSAVSEAMSRFKQVVQLCETEGAGLISERWRLPRLQGQVLTVQHGLAAPVGEPVLPGEAFLSLLGELNYQVKPQLPKGLLAAAPDQQLSPIDATLQVRIGKHQRLLLNDAGDEDGERVRAGLEWAFDAAIEKDETRAFLYACIGIEALLGDGEAERGGLTEKLADRCAFMLGESIRERRDLIGSFKGLYKLRSKLVHGRKKRLLQHERATLKQVRQLLHRILHAEVRALLTST